MEHRSQFKGIRGVYIIEQDSGRLYQTLVQRSQRFRELSQVHRARVAEMNKLYGMWLRSQAEEKRLTWTKAQPRATLSERVLRKIQ